MGSQCSYKQNKIEQAMKTHAQSAAAALARRQVRFEGMQCPVRLLGTVCDSSVPSLSQHF